MRKLVLGLLGATALAFGSTANAVIVTEYGPGDTPPGTTFNVFGDPINGPVAATFSHGGIGADTFMDTITFTIGADGLGSGDLTTSLVVGGVGSALDLDIFSVIFNGMAINGIWTDANNLECFTPNVGTCINQKYSGSGTPITAGVENTLVITGLARGLGGYSGTMTFLPTGAIPEPGTWAMMLLGFGAIGFAMRRRRTAALMQIA